MSPITNLMKIHNCYSILLNVFILYICITGHSLPVLLSLWWIFLPFIVKLLLYQCYTNVLRMTFKLSFLPWMILSPRVNWAMSRDFFGCHTGRDHTEVLYISQECSKLGTVHRTDPTTNTDLAQNVQCPLCQHWRTLS